MRCPYCGSSVEPARDTSGALFCPACQNSGIVSPAWSRAHPAASALGAGRRPGSAPRKAVAALILGVTALVVFPLAIVLGPLALAFGLKAVGELKRSAAGTPGQGMAVAGLALGGIAVLVGLGVVYAAAVAVLGRDTGETEDPVFAFEVEGEGPGGILRLSRVTGLAPLADWSDYELGGTAACALPSGGIDVGDEIVCVTDGDVVLRDWSEDETRYVATV